LSSHHAALASRLMRMAPIDSNGGPSASPSAADYSQLSDDQLRSAIRFVERHIRLVEEDHIELLRAYRDEMDAMRRNLFDRMFRRMTTAALPLSEERQRDLGRALEQHRMQADDIAAAIRGATEGRTDRLDSLTEIEAMGLLLRLKREL
jgi:hypothetical protein